MNFECYMNIVMLANQFSLYLSSKNMMQTNEHYFSISFYILYLMGIICTSFCLHLKVIHFPTYSPLQKLLYFRCYLILPLYSVIQSDIAQKISFKYFIIWLKLVNAPYVAFVFSILWFYESVIWLFNCITSQNNAYTCNLKNSKN